MSLLSHYRPAQTRVLRLGALVALLTALGCSSASDDAFVAEGGQDTADADPWGDPAAGAGDDSGGGDEGGSTGGDRDDAGEDSGGEPEPLPPSDDDGTFAGCPQPLPGSWVFCEDFETTVDPNEVMLDYQGLDGAFVLVDETGASGTHSMQVTYREGEEAAGWMVLSFGASPIEYGDRPTYAPDGSFREVYWRVRTKTEPGWPDVGPGRLTRTVAFADADWSEAVVGHLQSAGDAVVLQGVPSTCVAGAEVACTGFDDAGLENLDEMIGEAPLFSSEESGRWHCVEGRMRLNEIGAADGVFEYWVDDELQASRTNLDLRGDWDEYGINAVVVENLWPGGAPGPLRRWIDDLVVSTEPIGCRPGPAGATPN
ncbi:MAG: hypothetical protein AB1Z98_24795 [Nannocystaceae bacterium]